MAYFEGMNWTDKQRALGLAAMLLAPAVRADVTDPAANDSATNPAAANPTAANPYQVILDRNPFALKPPPPPPMIGPTNPPSSPSSVKLTGFTRDSTGPKVWLMIPPGPGKSGNPQYFSIAEHDKQGDIEVLEINDKENSAKILYAGNTLELNFKDNALPTPAGPPTPLAPGLPHGIPGALPNPGIVPAPGTPPPGLKTAAGAIPTGTAASEALAARYGLQPGQSTASPAVRTIPARNVRTAPVVEAQSQGTEGPVDPAVLRVLHEVQKRENPGIPPLPPLPGSN